MVYKFQGIFNFPLAGWLATMLAGAIVPVWFGLSIGPLLGVSPNHALPPHFLALTMLLPFSVMLLMLPVGTGFQYAPRYLISRARLTALLDFLLERPQLDESSLEPPVEPRGWWARQLAPWQCRERAPQ
jgi:hypothetical protein